MLAINHSVLRSVACAFYLLCGAAGAQNFPERPVTLICPWPAGGGTDVAMRALGEALAKQLGQRVVIENKPGASGIAEKATMERLGLKQ